MPQRTLKTMLAGGVCAFALAAGGMAAAQTRDFDVPAGDLSVALDAYARQSGVQIIYRIADVSGVRTQGARGALSSDEALAQLLEGTRFKIRRDPSGAIAIADASDPQSGSAAGDGAEGTVQALIVTAQKREENIQDVPIAMSAFTQEDLTRSQVAGGPDLMTQVPNMTFTKTNFSSYSIQIRGIGTQAISATTDPAVAVAFNNTPFIRNHFFEQEFYDLERVEVLRGPQGTLYGRNATAGVVNVISAKPKFHFEAKLSGDVSNYNSTRFEGMVNIPLVEDKAALRIAGAWTKRDGFVKNILTGQQTDGRDLWSARVTLGLEPTDRFRADLVFEHFEENDDRLRSGKQLCHKDPGPTEIGGIPVPQDSGALQANAAFFSQGCLPASMYSPDSFQTPNGFALPYYGPAANLGAPVYSERDPYASAVQSRDLREIETHIQPNYRADADIVELQLRYDLAKDLTLASETGFSRDFIFSFQDFNRFDTTPGVFIPGGRIGDFTYINEDGVFCDPQLGCTNRLAAGDVATASSQQFSQEFRLSSDFEGPINFNVGANFLRYDTEDKYYVFINSLTAFVARAPWQAGVSDNSQYFETNINGSDMQGYVWSDPNRPYGFGSAYIDPNNIHNLNDEGRNYFLSKNPYHLLSYAAFGEVYYSPTDKLKFTAGFRWTVDDKTAPQIPSWLMAAGSYGTPTRKVIHQIWREPTGRLAVDWKPDLSFTDETLVYASYVRGYKAGGANPPPPIIVLGPVGSEGLLSNYYINASLTHPEKFDAEFVNAFEIGSKNTVLDGRLTLNLAGFYYDYTGYQISQIVDRSAVNLNFDATVWGAELEADWRPLENLRLGLKLGFENTRLADGSKAIDLMDRTGGDPNWVLMKPFPPHASNCVIPRWLAEMVVGTYKNDLCSGYLAHVDPLTYLPYVPNPVYRLQENGETIAIVDSPTPWGVNLIGYPGYDPASANFGEGIEKDLSGNALPNAPHYTTTLTADYTIPLANSWLATLHTDLYYQSEAWTRIFNTPGYDKLKAYTNVNLAAIFSNEDAGWTVMAYVKNVFDRDSITGAFLNSDDTGLTTNVFLTEPRLFGLRVTKAWTGDWGGFNRGPGVYQPWRIEFGGLYGPFNGDHDPLAPPGIAFAEHPYPLDIQNDLDWGASGGVKLTYQPNPNGWSINGGIRYGRAAGSAEAHPKWAVTGGDRFGPATNAIIAGLTGLPIEFINERTAGKYFSPSAEGIYEYATTTASNEESFDIADFGVGRDVGLGRLGTSQLSAGLRYAKLRSASAAVLHGRPLVVVPESDVVKYGWEMHRFHGVANMSREFEGVGPAVDWDLSFPVLGDADKAGRLDLDIGVGGSVLWGRQQTTISGEIHGDSDLRQRHPFAGGELIDSYSTPLAIHRSTSAATPEVNANLGLSFNLSGLKVSGGYRVERYFGAIDGGVMRHKAYDRQYDGPYFKVSFGFGG